MLVMKMKMLAFLEFPNIFFEEDVDKKLHLVNFIAILRDGSTDNSVIEQEVLYAIFTDSETFKPNMKFF